MCRVYADNNATTALAPEALDAMLPYLREQYFNPSSMYDAAREPARALDQARRRVARLLGGVSTDEILFTGSATESNNTAIFGAISAQPSRRHIVTSAVEHPAVYEVCREARRRGCDVDFIPVDRRGNLDRGAYVRALRKDTLLVSLMHGNNETGVLFPIADLARIAKETDPSILFHTDATQTVGKIPVSCTGDLSNVDLLSFSGHKLHGPKGVGCLFVRRGTPLRPYLVGGHQERGRRAGTENVPHITGLGMACELALERLDDERRVAAMRDRLQQGLQRAIPYLEVNGEGAPRLPNTLNLAVHGIEGESILYELDAEGVCASSGSACTSGSLDPSHVLKAMNVPFGAVHGSVRFSFCRYNTEEDIDHILAVFPPIVARLRKLSPFWDDAEQCPRLPGEGSGISEPIDGMEERRDGQSI
jgi:cysteine desulfurase